MKSPPPSFLISLSTPLSFLPSPLFSFLISLSASLLFSLSLSSALPALLLLLSLSPLSLSSLCLGFRCGFVSACNMCHRVIVLCVMQLIVVRDVVSGRRVFSRSLLFSTPNYLRLPVLVRNTLYYLTGTLASPPHEIGT